MSCTFCRIAGGELPAAIVHEDELSLVFLDHRPLFKGHCLVIPRAHHATLKELPVEDLGAFFGIVQKISEAVRIAMEAKGSFVAINNVISQSVPHLHAHVVPRSPKDGLRGFFWPRTKYESEEEIEEVRARIAKALSD